jgi:hypothetical protein
MSPSVLTGCLTRGGHPILRGRSECPRFAHRPGEERTSHRQRSDAADGKLDDGTVTESVAVTGVLGVRVEIAGFFESIAAASIFRAFASAMPATATPLLRATLSELATAKNSEGASAMDRV